MILSSALALGLAMIAPPQDNKLAINPDLLKSRFMVEKLREVLGPMQLIGKKAVAQKKYTHLWVMIMSGADDLRQGGTASFFFEMEDGTRGVAQLAAAPVSLPGHTMLNWRWDIPDGLDVDRIKHVGITTKLSPGGGLDRPDKWEISRVQVMATNGLNGGAGKEILLIDEPVKYAFYGHRGEDEWKSGEVQSYRGPQFVRTDWLSCEIISPVDTEPGSTVGEWNPTTLYRAYVDLMDGRRFSTSLMQLSSITTDRFQRRHSLLPFRVPGITRSQIRRFGLHVFPNTATAGNVARTQIAQIKLHAMEDGIKSNREWMNFSPNLTMNRQKTSWQTPDMAPLVLPADIRTRYGVEIWSGDDDLRDDSTIEMVFLLRPKDMFEQPRKFVQVVHWGKEGARPGLTGLWRGSGAPSNSPIRFGITAPLPLPPAKETSDNFPKLSEIMGIGIIIRPGPGGGLWNPDTFTVRHFLFYYTDGTNLRELIHVYDANLTFNSSNTEWISSMPAIDFGDPLRWRSGLGMGGG